MSSPGSEGWYLLIVSTPGRQAALRMRLWRSLKASGAATLRDGVYVLPRRPALKALLDAHADDVAASGGSAQWLEVDSGGDGFARLFDRTAEYAELAKRVGAARKGLRRANARAMPRQIEKLRQVFQGIASRDFFPGQAQAQAAGALDTLVAETNAILSPGEPRPAAGPIDRLAVADYRGRVWATRKRPWIDRLASAWLIRRFIDSKASIRWLDSPGDCPDRALGFDFDGARFTHTGGLVTFEVIAASFALPQTPALEKLQSIVHYLDVGGLPVPEAAGVELVLSGMRNRHEQDDALLAAAEELFDALYAATPVPGRD